MTTVKDRTEALEIAVRILKEIMGDLIRVSLVDGEMLGRANKDLWGLSERIEGMESFVSSRMKDLEDKRKPKGKYD